MIGFAFLQLACVYLLHTAVTSSTSLVWRHVMIPAATVDAYISLLILSILALTEKYFLPTVLIQYQAGSL